MPTSTSNIPIHPGFSWRRTGQKLLAGLLAALVAGSSMLSSMPVVMAKSLGVGEVIKEVISSDRFTVADGVTYEEALFKTEDGKTVAGFMLDTNYGTEGSNLHIAVGMPNNGTEFAMQRVSDQMRYAAIDGRNVLAGVNADFYNMSTGEPEGLVVKNGIQVHAWTPSAEISSRLPYRTFFGILKDGTAIIGDEEVYEANKANLEQAVGGDYILVDNGVPISFDEGTDTSSMPDRPTAPYPRTCVGIRQDGSVFFICMDGKRPDTYSAGLTLVEMAQLLVENGAVYAMNLDGGGSTTMVVKDPETQQYTVQNSPSDGTSGPTGGTERSVANCLYIYNDEKPDIPEVTLDQDINGYYLIRDIKDFAQINRDPRADYRLANNIDAAGKPVEAVMTFDGTLDGDGHTINNLLYASPTSRGLIELLGPGGVIQDLTITNAVLESTASDVGILAGQSSGIIRNVNVSGEVKGTGTVGGLVGRISGSGVAIENCHVVADVTAQDSYAGILAAHSNAGTAGEIKSCSVKGSVSGGVGVGGLIGYILDTNALWIRDCAVVDTTVHGDDQHVGGLAGMAKCGVEHCFVSDVTVQQDAPNQSSKHSASLLTGWHNYGQLSISNNVIYRGSITTNNTANSHRVAEGNGTRENNYASEEITINGEYRNGGDAYYEGISKPERELMVQSFYEGLGFRFEEDGAWEWDVMDDEAARPRIKAVEARQMTTEKVFRLSAPVFIDCTGDGTLSAMAGADYHVGREAAAEYGEPGAVKKADRVTMGNSILFQARDAGRPVPFIKPAWAYTFTDDDLMGHDKEITSGYWWVEVGGTVWDTVADAEEIRDELLKIVYGIWDHIKNGGDHGADTLALEWVGFLPGKRESRRVLGDYVLKEQDLLAGRVFPDAVGYGGWHIDSHPPERFRCIAAKTEESEDLPVHLPGLYTIPYRSLYARGVENLLLGGRIISATHRAFASTRVMGTCAVLAQAAGTAAAWAAERGVTPRELGADVAALQQRLLRDDCYIPGVRNEDPDDLARGAAVVCSSGDGAAVIDGVSRITGWVSAPLEGEAPWLELRLPQAGPVGEIRLTFDSDLSAEIMPSLSDWAQNRQSPLPPATLVQDYVITVFLGDRAVHTQTISGNYQRHRIHALLAGTVCDRLRVTVLATQGDERARILEARLYAEAQQKG